VEVSLDRLVELLVRQRLQQLDHLGRRVQLLAVDRCARLTVGLAVLRHYDSTSTPMLRAVPAMMRAACSTSRAFRSGIFVSAIWRTWSRVRRPPFSRLGSGQPFSIRSASLIRAAAGGVAVMNSKDRSS